MIKRVCSKQYKVLSFIVQSMCVFLVVGCLCFLNFGTAITVQSSFGTYQYQIDFWKDTSSYEETGFFDTMLRRQVYDLMRYMVIRNQMEDEGEFNGLKEVDIQAYAMRHELEQMSYESARYHIEDLIKWGQYGFAYDGDYLIELYKTVDYLDLEDYVNTNLDYPSLVKYLKSTSEDIAYNYRQYIDYGKRYGEMSTNARYYIVIEEYGESKVYTNLEVQSIEEAREIICGTHSSYVDYDMKSLLYDTNTSIIEEDMIQEMSRYGYTYMYYGNSQIIIGIDTNYPNEDDFLTGYEIYNQVIPVIPYAISIAMIASIVFVVLFVLSTIVAGRNEYAKEVIFLKIDELPTEIFVLLLVEFLCIINRYSNRLVQDGILSTLNKSILIPVLFISVYVIYLMGFTMTLSFVRRLKGNNVIRRSVVWYCIKITYKVLVQMFSHMKRTYCYLLRNKVVTIRTFVPYFGFLGMNIVLLNIKDLGIILAVIVDCLVALILLRENQERDEIIQTINQISNGELEVQLDYENMTRQNQVLGRSVNLLRDGIKEAVETSRKDERLKSELITNVSHDIKTPLTSIINYVDLLKREEFENERMQSYLVILDQKSNRLKHLIEDLVEASKISSGNIELIMEELNIVQLMKQSLGEFIELFERQGLQLVTTIPTEAIQIKADGRRIWRIIENLVVNALKYSLDQTRVYIDVFVIEEEKKVVITIRNISKEPLHVSVEELTERFTRGDAARTTEGSGLGLSIAKNLTQLQGGTFAIESDGDLFKVSIGFAVIE
ncbi:MAG: HAMP domain-containing sensor histidine kinase [Eubacteriales bacterium]